MDPLPSSTNNQDIVQAIDALTRATIGLQGQVTSYSNGGTAGGTFYYTRIGGIKVLWGKSAASTSIPNNANAVVTVTLPSGFFNSVTAAIPSIYLPGDNRMGALTTAESTSSISVLLQSLNAGASSTSFNLLVIGT